MHFNKCIFLLMGIMYQLWLTLVGCLVSWAQYDGVYRS